MNTTAPKFAPFRRLLLGLAATLACALVVTSSSQGLGPSVAMAQPADALAKAKAEYDAGRRLFDAGDYRGAIAAYARAEAASPSAYNDFNIGLCYDKLGEAEFSVQYYRSFLAKLPTASNRATVEASVARLETAITAAKAKADDAGRAEEARLAAARAADDARRAEDARRAQDARLAEQARLAAEADRPIDPTALPPAPLETMPAPPAPRSSGDAELDRVAAIDIASARTQQGFVAEAGSNAGAAPAVAGDVQPMPGEQPAEPAKAKPFYKQWWFWVVAGVGAYVLISIASNDSSDSANTGRLADPNRSMGTTLLTF